MGCAQNLSLSETRELRKRGGDNYARTKTPFHPNKHPSTPLRYEGDICARRSAPSRYVVRQDVRDGRGRGESEVRVGVSIWILG